MTTMVPVAPTLDVVCGAEYASWARRVVAALLDAAVLGAVTWFVAGDTLIAPTLQPTFGMDHVGAGTGARSWASSPVVVGAWLLMLVVQGITGQTPGRRIMGIAVVRVPATGGSVGEPPGVLRSIARWFAHLLDAILLIGYLRPLWDRERRTFADSLLGTVVVRRRQPWAPEGRGIARRNAHAVTAGAYLLVSVGLAAGVTVGQSGGVDRVADSVCALGVQSPAAPVQVDSALLALETEWHANLRLWPWAGHQRRTDRNRVWLDVAWRADGTPTPEQAFLARTTTSAGLTVDNHVPLADGWARVPVENAVRGAVNVTFLLDDKPLTSCSATVPS